ncbi:TraV family lipoprotein, partial [Klebsiella pneumoniae]
TGAFSRFRNMLPHSLPLDYLGTLHVLDLSPRPLWPGSGWTVASTFTSPSTPPGNYPRPLRKGEETTSLWIAPYVDSDDVYHQ